MSKRVKIIIAILVVAVLSVPIGILVVDKVSAAGTIYSGVQISGTSVGDLTKEEATKVLEEKYNNSIKDKKLEVVYKEKDFSYLIEYKALDARYDIASAVDEAMNYGKDGNAFTRVSKRISLKSTPQSLKLKFLVNDAKVDNIVKEIASKVDVEPVNATITPGETLTVVDEQDGLKVKQDKLKESIKNSLNPDKDKVIVNVPVDVEKAKVKAEQLKAIDTKLGEQSTSFSGSASGRVKNISVASSAINGTVVMPGEVFSTSKAMGPRVKSEGYEEAPTIVSGTLTPGLGGGVCQVSSTLYNAIVKADLEIVERRAHSLRVKYLPASRDAVIAEDYIDLKFKNNTEYPVMIVGYTSGSDVTMAIYGSSKLPKKTVEISSQVYQTRALPPKKGEDKPRTESRSRAYKKVYDENGNLIKEETLSDDVYKG